MASLRANITIDANVFMLFVAALQLLHLEEFVSSDGDNIMEMQIVKEEVNKLNEKPFSVGDLSFS